MRSLGFNVCAADYRPSYRKEDFLHNPNLHNAKGLGTILHGETRVIEAIRPSLVENGAMVDIEIWFGADPDQREGVIMAMLAAGYSMVRDELNTLTFLKENE